VKTGTTPKRTRLIEELRAIRVIPVIRTRLTQEARTAIEWLLDAGFRTFEVTLTVPDAIPLIRDLSADRSLLIGAGTVPNEDTARSCIAAGARFIVAPWIDRTLAAPCQESDTLLMLGAATPSEVRTALSASSDVVKIFPAATAGGPAHIKALRSVFPDIPICPTGGVGPGNLADYIAAGADFVGMGGSLVDVAQIKAGNREAIQAVGRAVLRNAKGERLQA
jgi:2-dehydro-3-deoxyphosphogluconate aldolase/(4S)-4-hydroxy-2-oxoglutarate aldolase